jgi:hypothetical protein
MRYILPILSRGRHCHNACCLLSSQREIGSGSEAHPASVW